MIPKVELPAAETGPQASLGPTPVIDSDHPHVFELARGVAGQGSDGARAVRLFDWVRDLIAYNLTPVLDTRDSWRASLTLKRKNGFCQQKAVLLAAMGRAAGIPTALCFQHIRDHKLLDGRYAKMLPGGIIAYHGLMAFWLEGKWVRADPSLDADLCNSRRYRRVAFDGVTDALLPATDLDDRPHFDLLEHLGPYADLPGSIAQLLIDARPIWDSLRAISGSSM
jgi:hypothetical protein